MQKISTPTGLTEAQEQIKVCEYLDLLKLRGHKIKYTAIPNGTYTPYKSQHNKNKATGLHKGFPDLFLIINGVCITIEMKRASKSITSVEQKEWIEALNNAGIPSFVCKGFEQAREVIDKYVKSR